MRLLATQPEICSTFSRLVKEADEIYFAVAWASCGFGCSDELLKSSEKVKRAVVGTHFYQTDPDFIEHFKGQPKVKFVLNPDGVFHPKAYLFQALGEKHILVGSANFTSGAFGGNNEIVVHIEPEDDQNNSLFSEVKREIIRYWNSANAKPADKVNLSNYRFMRIRFRNHLKKAQGQFGSKASKKTPDQMELLSMDWPRFLSKVRADQYHALEKRIEVLAEAELLFRNFKSLSAMPLAARQGIAGTAGKATSIPWGWFGTMQGSGIFQKLINSNSKHLSAALDEIPAEGPVQRQDFKAYVARYVKAYPRNARGERHRHGLGTASRLLAMKRPDYFVCFDKANRAGITGAFGVGLGNHDYDDYWDGIIERIIESQWWNARRPKEKIAGQVWDGRAAFLDALYYASEPE